MALFEQVVSSVGLIVVTILLGLTFRRRVKDFKFIGILSGWFILAAFALQIFYGAAYLALILVGLGLSLAIALSLQNIAHKPN